MTSTRSAIPSVQVARELQGAIHAREFLPGTQLPTEEELCSRFAVSRAVLREAILQLKADGYVETRPGAGAFIPAQPGRVNFRLTPNDVTDDEDLKHILELRLAVEVAAAELAARRRTAADLTAMRRALDTMTEAIRHRTDASAADENFHLAIAVATRNPHIQRFIEFLRYQFGATRRPTWSQAGHQANEPKLAQQEHERLFAAIRAADADEARAAAHDHLMSSAQRLGFRAAGAPKPSEPPRRPDEGPLR
jgi:GntR family transcriptional repressor for pyruvate dehydrogenase complex